jgi:hypothetical protein
MESKPELKWPLIPAMGPALSEWNSSHNLSYYSFKNNFNIILSSTLKCPFLSGFPAKGLYSFQAYLVSHSSHFPRFRHCSNIG